MGRAPARLKRRRDFLRVAAARRKWVAPGLILQMRPQDGGAEGAGTGRSADGPPMRVGFTVSRKVGGAVARNRARRRLRAAADAILPAHAAPGHDSVVIGRAATLRREFEALEGDMKAALRALGAWRNGEEA